MSRATVKKVNYNTTIIGCFVGYVVQAIVNNFVPLLFLTFQKEYNIPLSQITLLVTFNFGVQLLVDAAAIGFVDRIGHRASMILAHIFSAAGFICLTVLPDVTSEPFVGILIAVMVYAVGGGLLEVLVSPIMEACPTDNKEKAMSLLHSFYCWGHVGVVVLSTVFFAVFGIENWRIMAIIWAVVPVINGILFTRVPIASLLEDGDKGMSLLELFKQKMFWVLIIMMLAAGASEQAVSQWSSAFAEKSFHISKTLGDLIGPMMFAVLMGSARAFYGRFGEKINLERFMIGSSVLCVISYLLIAIFPNPILGMIGCGLCGVSVGIMWPGTFSIASASLRRGGTAMFALLALAGDVGCGGGPTVVGLVSSAFGDDLTRGILVAIIFPVLMILGIGLKKHYAKNS
ncbi:MAG: MFS transporter [Lachnospiraceae bacterium]|nr:MFS transporter [Lachnospiraceae bacterium]